MTRGGLGPPAAVGNSGTACYESASCDTVGLAPTGGFGPARLGGLAPTSASVESGGGEEGVSRAHPFGPPGLDFGGPGAPVSRSFESFLEQDNQKRLNANFP